MVTFDYKKSPITQIADYIIMYSAKSGASDIHFDPHEDGLMVRIRIDGDLRDYTLVPLDYERNLITRLKLLANMNITESRLPQDGSIKGKFGNLFLDMRVSSLPTNEGEKIVIRILDYTRSLEGLETLGFSHTNFEKLQRMIAVPNGILLVTGATGSGKSTTTYSILQELNKKEVNIITVEDPVEMNIEGLNQVQVNSDIGLDFATVLRSILRQDPNIILIGEIRDSETAKIAVRASITGHFVLSTIHTNNSLSTIERLLDMDVERYLLSSALTGIISQRLAKMVCPKCRVLRETTEYEKKVFKKALGKDVDKIYDANHDGCSECHNGYRDRIAVQEVLEIDDDIRTALNNDKLSKDDMRKMVYTSNVITLLQDGLNKVLDGITTFEEIYRIIEIDIDDDDSLDNNSTEDNDDIEVEETKEEITKEKKKKGRKKKRKKEKEPIDDEDSSDSDEENTDEDIDDSEEENINENSDDSEEENIDEDSDSNAESDDESNDVETTDEDDSSNNTEVTEYANESTDDKLKDEFEDSNSDNNDETYSYYDFKEEAKQNNDYSDGYDGIYDFKEEALENNDSDENYTYHDFKEEAKQNNDYSADSNSYTYLETKKDDEIEEVPKETQEPTLIELPKIEVKIEPAKDYDDYPTLSDDIPNNENNS